MLKFDAAAMPYEVAPVSPIFWVKLTVKGQPECQAAGYLPLA